MLRSLLVQSLLRPVLFPFSLPTTTTTSFSQSFAPPPPWSEVADMNVNFGGQTNTTIGRIRRRPVETRPASSRKKRRCMNEESDSGQEKVNCWNIDSISRHMFEISQLYFRLIRSTACTHAEEGTQTCLASEADIQKFTSSATAAPSSPSEAEKAPASEVPYIVNATEAPPTLPPPLETHETSHTDAEAQHNLPTAPYASEHTQQPEEARHIDQLMLSDAPPSEIHISPLVDVEANNETTANVTIHPFPAVVEHAQEPEVVQHLDLQDSARSTTDAASSQPETAVDAALVSEEPQTPPTTEAASTFPSDIPQSEVLQVSQADVAASGEVPKDVCTVPSPEPTFPSDVPPPETLDALHADVKADDDVLRHSLAILSPTVEHTQLPEVSQHLSLPTVPTETVKAPMARQVSPPPSPPAALVSSEDLSAAAQGWLFPLSAPAADPVSETALSFSEGATPITHDPPSESVEVEMADEGLPPYAPSAAFVSEEYSTTDPPRWSFEEQKAAVIECMPPFVDSIDNSNYIGAMAPQLSGLTRDMPMDDWNAQGQYQTDAVPGYSSETSFGMTCDETSPDMVSWIVDATFDRDGIESSYQAQSSAPYEFDVAMDEDMLPQTTSAQVASEMPVEIFLSTISLPPMAEDYDLPDYDDDDTGVSTQSLLFVAELSLSHVPHGPNQPDHSAPGIDVDEDVVPITTHQSRWGFSQSRNETWTALRLDEQVEYVWPTEEPATAADEEIVHDIFIDDTSAIVHSPQAVVSDMIIVSSDGDEDRETVEDKLWRKVLRLNAWLSSIMRGGTGGDIDTNDESGVLLTEGRRDVLMFFNQQLHCTKWTKTMERHYRLTGRWRREEQERHAREEMEREGDAEDEDQDAAKENEQPKVGHLRKQDDDVVKALTAQMRNQLSIELVPLGTTTSRLGHGEHVSVDNSEGDNLATALAGITLATQDN